MLEDTFDDSVDFIPATPSPVLNKRFKPLSTNPCREEKTNKGAKDNHALKEFNIEGSHEATKSKSTLSLPGQPGFVQEREKALRLKKQKEHLSPFKSKSCSKLENAGLNPVCKTSSPSFSGFVKSSSLLNKLSGSGSPLTSTVSSHKLIQKRKSPHIGEPCSNRTKLRKTVSSNSVRPSTSTSTSKYGWPSSSDSSSDEESLLSKFKTKPVKLSTTTTRPSATVTCTLYTSPLKHTSPTVISNQDCAHKINKDGVMLKDKVKSQTCKYNNIHVHNSNSSHHKKSTITKTTSKSSGKDLTAPWHNYMAEESTSSGEKHTPYSYTELQIAQQRKPSLPSLPKSVSNNSSSLNTSVHKLNNQDSVISNVPYTSTVPATSNLPSWSGTPYSAEWKTPKNSRTPPQKNRKSASLVSGESADIIFVSDAALPDNGSEDNPIDLDLLTPDTKKAYEHIQQLQTDEEMAKKLQEELDREFALSMQAQAEAEPDCPDGHVDHGERFFTPPLHSPVRTRGRRRGRGAVGGRSTRMQNELRDLLEDSENSMIGPDLDFILALSSAHRSRRGAVDFTGLAGLVASPNASGNDYEFLMNLSEQIGDAKPKGLSKSASNQLPVVTYKKQQDKSEECHICMTEYEDGDSQKILPCFHNYHAKCIDKWIAKNATCPVCRVEVKLN